MEWTQDKKDELEKLIKTQTVQEIANHFGISYSAIATKLNRLGLSVKKAQNITWTKEEDEILKNICEFAPKEFIMEKIPNRTWSSISQRMNNKFNIKVGKRDSVYVKYDLFDTWTEKSAYILGFILADGYIQTKNKDGNNKFNLQFEQKSTDIDIIYKICAALEFRGKIFFSKNKRNVKIIIHNSHLIKEAINKGIPEENKTFCAKFPDNIPKDMIRHFIRGLIDGDGWSSINKDYRNNDRYILGFCGTEALVNRVKELLPEKLDNIKISKSSNNCWRFNIEKQKAFNIAKWLYEDTTIYLERKFQAYNNAKHIYDNMPRG